MEDGIVGVVVSSAVVVRVVPLVAVVIGVCVIIFVVSALATLVEVMVVAVVVIVVLRGWLFKPQAFLTNEFNFIFSGFKLTLY